MQITENMIKEEVYINMISKITKLSVEKIDGQVYITIRI